MQAYAFYTPTEQSTYPIALLVPTIRKQEIEQAYFTNGPVSKDDVMVLSVYTRGKKTPMGQIKAYIKEELVEILEGIKAEYVLCGQGDYFKALTGVSKIEPSMGYVLDSQYGDFKVVYIPNYMSIFYDPDKVKVQISRALEAVASHRNDAYQRPGADIIKFADYPTTDDAVEAWLDKLIEMNVPLSVDTENFSLKHHTSGLGTITFCWSKHEGIAFEVDYQCVNPAQPYEKDENGFYGKQVRNERRRELLRQFFIRLSQGTLYHNLSYDVYILIYQLFMKDILDTEGLLKGLDILMPGAECTKIITYLATNSTAGNKLSLKDQSQEFAGNYAQDDIKDIRKIPLPQLLEYNLVDGLATWFTFEKRSPQMIADDQLEVYEQIFRPALWDIIQMQLTGLPLDMPRVKEVKEVLEAIEKDAFDKIQGTNLAQEYTYILREQHVAKRNAKLKKKQISINDDECLAVVFNINSAPQLQHFLYEHLELPIIARTKDKLPATGRKTIEALVNHTQDPEVLKVLQGLLDYKAVNKLLTAFIPAFEDAALGSDGWHYLFGNFNLGGTQSGRLSSSDPNLQNLPANVFMDVSDSIMQRFGEMLAPFIKKGKLGLGKLIKTCFKAPPGWLFVGLDFDSLEDRISALLTKDPNKLKVYTDGYDGHCLRAYSYFGMKMSDIDPKSVESINSIADKYPDERQASKVPTFLLTYGGTWLGITQQTGIDRQKAAEIEDSYHELYKVSDDWIDAKLEEATKTGYVTAAFGLRVRTPLLKQVVRGTSKTPHEAEAEGRSAGNAMGQSWCMLNTRASTEFMQGVRKSEFRLDIRPSAHIHDAQYLLIRDAMEPLLYTNEHLVKAVQWQDHPDIWHDEVKLGGRLGIFWPDWSKEIEIPNNAKPNLIRDAIALALA